MLQDTLLIWKLRHGDRDALSRIYEKYRDDLLRIAAGLLEDRSLAEDAVHDVFAAFVGISGRLSLTSNLKGYLITCTANKARNLNRTKHRQPTVSLDESQSTESSLVRPDQWIILDEQFRLLCNAMTELPYPQRETIVLHLHGDMKFKDIAALQEIPIKTVMSRYRYGIDKLRSLLNGEVQK